MANKFLDRIFPVKYDFYAILREQTSLTSRGVRSLYTCFAEKNVCSECEIISFAVDADIIRMDMESKLIDAFTTPFDRQDIYSISVEMDKIIETAKAALLAVIAYEVEPDEVTIMLASRLADGLEDFCIAMNLLEKKPREAESMIEKMRLAVQSVELTYRQGMSVLFKTDDPMLAMRFREIYRHLRDAAIFFDQTVDRFHKIVVRQA